MTMKALRVSALAAATALAAGCGGGVPKRLPPPPGPAGFVIGALAGSRDDFLRSVPSDRVYFAPDVFSLDGEDWAVLDAQAAWLLRNPAVRITVEGHSDDRKTRDYSLALADRRANAAAVYLQARGILASRMTVVSWGKERPAAPGPGDAAAAQNNRVVIVVGQ